jgi:hypothetical protein
MPSSVAVAVASSFVANSAVVAGVLSTLGAKIAGAIVGAVLSNALAKRSSSGSVEQRGRTLTVRQPISPWATIYGRTRVPGVITYIQATAANAHLHVVITFAGHPCDAIESVYFGDEEVTFGEDGITLGRYNGFTYFEPGLGSETVQPFPNLVEESGGLWTDAHRQSGRCKLHIKLATNRNLFPAGLPNITARIRGKKVYDPRSGLTVWSDNPALCLADYLADQSTGFGADYATEIDLDMIAAAANICDELVTLANGLTEKRYTCNGIIYADEAPNDVLPKLVSAMQGWAVLIGGKWRIRAGAYITPTVTLGVDDFRGPVQVQSRMSRRDNFNSVKGVFVSPQNLWQPSDFPPVISTTYAADDGERVWKDVSLPFTDSPTMAQRIAKIDLLKARQPITVQAQLKLSAYVVQPPETVMLTLPRFGWTAKVFEVLESTLVVAEGEGGPVFGVDVTMRETAPEVYDWTTDEEGAFDPAPNTNFPNPFLALPPGTPSIAETLYQTTGSAGVKSRAVVTWVAPANASVTRYEVQFKAAGDPDWVAGATTTATTAHIDDLTPGVYDFRVRSVSAFEVSSDWSGERRAELYGLTEAPADVSGFSVIGSNGFALSQWTQHTDLDVRIGGAVIIRHSPLTTGATWNDGIIIGEADGASNRYPVPLQTGTFFAKAKDSAGNYSDTAASFVLTEGLVGIALGVDGSLTEDPGFTGTKVATTVASSKLELTSGFLFDSASGNFDAAAGNFDAYGGQEITGTYESSTHIDCTSVAMRRWEAHVKAHAVDNSNAFDEHQGLFDAADGRFDGGVINDADVTVEIALTDDDPAGTPTWSGWIPFNVGDFSARAAKFRATLSVATPKHNIQVSELRFEARS